MSARARRGPAGSLSELWRTGGPLAVVASLVRRAVGEPMTWEAYAFDQVKRIRQARVPATLARLRCPNEPELVSIVLPVHNGARYLAEALDSILAQTYTRFELIAVDDGSTDATPRILAAYAARDPRIRVLRQPNRRLPAALSAGFRAARGELLTWTSDDNRLRPDFLRRMVEGLRRHPHWDMLYADVDLIDDDGAPLRASDWYWNYQTPPGSEHIALPRETSELNVRPNNHVGAAFLYRDRVDALLGDYSALRFGTEDYDYWMQVNLLLRLRHADPMEPLYEYRFHRTSLTARDDTLGITRGRTALMVFDDFRRDLVLTPLVLIIEAGSEASARETAHALAARAIAAGAIVVDPTAPVARALPALLTVGVHVTVVERVPASAPRPADAPPHVLRVLVVTGGDALPADPGPAWDLCIATARDAVPTRTVVPRQGWLVAPDPDVLHAAVDVRSRAYHARRLEEELARPPVPAYRASVVVCTYRRAALLEPCVRSLVAQRMPSDAYEVVIVNNDPTDAETERTIARLRATCFAEAPHRLQAVLCPVPGLSSARNAGLAAARGAVVCFIDDDATADPDWLVQLCRVYDAHPDAGVVGGTIHLRTPTPRPRAARHGWDGHWSAFAPDHPFPYEPADVKRYPYGANWSARRNVLLAIGGFRTAYGRRGADFGGGEEIVAATLVRQLGHRVLVAPDAVVVHAPDPSRFTFRHVWRTILRANVTWYRQQCAGYVARDLGLHRALRWPARDLKRALGRTLDASARIELVLQAFGSALAAGHFVSDVLRRLRRPVATQ